MRIQRLPGELNVLRFPVERRARPTLMLLRDLAPDAREVLAIAEAFDLDLPVQDLRDRVDAATASHIAGQVPLADPERTVMLADMLNAVVVAAVMTCREAHDAAIEAAEARQRLQRADTGGQVWLEPPRARAEALSLRAAELMVAAHARAEEAEGVARAVGIARRGEGWSPRNAEADMEMLLAVRRTG